MSDIRIGAPPRALRWLMVALIGCLCTSCQFLGLDMYPPELQNASTNCDLPALVLETTGATFKRVQTMRQVTAGALDVLFVICETNSSNVLVILDPQSLAYLGCIVGTSTPFGTSVEEHFCAGDKDFPNIGVWTTYSIINASINVTNYRFLHPSKSESLNILTRINNGYLEMEEAASVSSVWSNTGTKSAWIDSSHSTNWDLTDMAVGSTATRLLLRNNNTKMTSYVEYSGPPASLYSDLDTYLTSLLTSLPPVKSFSTNSERAWLLDDYIVYFENDNDKLLIRWSLSDRIEIDSHLIDSKWKQSIYFEPTGERWYYYDTRVSKLCVLRTWW